MSNSKEIENPSFDKNASRALKGIAILLMILHHNFRSVELFKSYSVSFFPFQEQQVINLALSCKICVSIFAFISGYGLFLSYRDSKTNASAWVAKRYILTFSGYWFVWIICSIVSQIIDERATRILCGGNIPTSIIYTLIDFIGLHNLFNTPSVNGTWWYMSAAAVFILLTPILYRFRNNLWLTLFIPCVFIRIIHSNDTSSFTGSNSVYAFLSPFIFGAIFANYHYFDKWCSIGSHRISTKICKCLAEIFILFLLYIMYLGLSQSVFWEFHYGIYLTVFVLFCVEFLIPISFIKSGLEFLGKHSMNVFLVHTFIRGYYLADFTYSYKHFVIICLILLIVSITISVVIEKAKVILHYDKLIHKLVSSV